MSHKGSVTRNRNIAPLNRGGCCYVTEQLRVLRNSYATRELRLQLKGQHNIETAECYARGVTDGVTDRRPKRPFFKEAKSLHNREIIRKRRRQYAAWREKHRE